MIRASHHVNTYLQNPMPWFLIAYLLVFVLVGLAGIAEDWQSRRALAFIAGMLIALSVGVLCIWAFALEAKLVALLRPDAGDFFNFAKRTIDGIEQGRR